MRKKCWDRSEARWMTVVGSSTVSCLTGSPTSCPTLGTKWHHIEQTGGLCKGHAVNYVQLLMRMCAWLYC